jgi:AcrR family transcriptional regulator
VTDRSGNKNVVRGEATRARLIEIGTRLFASRGYEGTSIEAVLQEADVSRGSLYHHFASKEALFEAVLVDVGERVGARNTEAVLAATGPAEALRIGSLAWIRTAGDPAVSRILLIDAPSVIGWERWRALDEPALGMIRAALQAVADEGRMQPALVDTFAHVLVASLNEVALLVAQSEDPEAAMRSGAQVIDHLLHTMLGP